MIAPEQRAEIRRLFFAEHWKIGTIASQLGLHPDTVRAALDTASFNRGRRKRRQTLTAPYLDFIRETLERHPRLRATRIFEMIRARGYQGSVVQLRRVVRELRPQLTEAFASLRVFPGEQAQVDWAHFGYVDVGRAKRRLSCFLMVLSWSRALSLEFFFDQTLENFLRGHVRAFDDYQGVPRLILYDNLRSAVLERKGELIRFHPRLIELCAHYHFQARPCRPMRGNEKGRVERAVRFVRESFFAARPFTTLDDFNRQARIWRDHVAHARPWPDDRTRTVEQQFADERRALLALPKHPFDTDLIKPVRSKKTIYVRFDLNDYSIPPAAVGRSLTLAASDREIRILDGATQVARHKRSYDRGRKLEDPAHQKALLEDKRKALGATRNGRLAAAVPESEALLAAAFARGEPSTAQTSQLLRLLDDYGAKMLREAVQQALERGTPRASSVAYLLSQMHRAQARKQLLPVHLERRPDLEDLHVQPHDPETYDELFRREDHD